MMTKRTLLSLVAALATAAVPASAQVEAVAHITVQGVKKPTRTASPPPAVLWLIPQSGQVQDRLWPQQGPFVLLQKNRMFMPHLLVVPVGATVSFPNADPFFHNVFSLFDGKRFDLGLYESGSSKTVVFNRAGVSYLFCNIHSSMSAVVLALNTPLWSVSSQSGELRIPDVAAGDYEAHLWVEGESAETLERWTHRVTLHPGTNNLGEIHLSPSTGPAPHSNKFGQPYAPDTNAY